MHNSVAASQLDSDGKGVSGVRAMPCLSLTPHLVTCVVAVSVLGSTLSVSKQSIVSLVAVVAEGDTQTSAGLVFQQLPQAPSDTPLASLGSPFDTGEAFVGYEHTCGFGGDTAAPAVTVIQGLSIVGTPCATVPGVSSPLVLQATLASMMVLPLEWLTPVAVVCYMYCVVQGVDQAGGVHASYHTSRHSNTVSLVPDAFRPVRTCRS